MSGKNRMKRRFSLIIFSRSKDIQMIQNEAIRKKIYMMVDTPIRAGLSSYVAAWTLITFSFSVQCKDKSLQHRWQEMNRCLQACILEQNTTRKTNKTKNLEFTPWSSRNILLMDTKKANDWTWVRLPNCPHRNMTFNDIRTQTIVVVELI